MGSLYTTHRCGGYSVFYTMIERPKETAASIEDDGWGLPTPETPIDHDDPFLDQPSKALDLRAFQLANHMKGKWYDSIRKATANHPLLAVVKKAINHPDWLLHDEVLVRKGKDDSRDCPYVPYEANHEGVNIRSEIVRITHEQMAHMGWHKCFDYASRHFYWHSMRNDFKDYICRCHLC